MEKELISEKKCFEAIENTVVQFASSTSIHGIAYVFDRGIQACDRFLWLLLVCFGAGLAIHMSHEAWTDWKSRFYEVDLNKT